MNATVNRAKKALAEYNLQKKVEGKVADELDKRLHTMSHSWNVVANSIALLAVAETFGCGKKKLTEFLENMANVQDWFCNTYGDDCDAFAMQRKIKELYDIDIEKYVNEIEADNSHVSTFVHV